jgi:hypothetical protein
MSGWRLGRARLPKELRPFARRCVFAVQRSLLDRNAAEPWPTMEQHAYFGEPGKAVGLFGGWRRAGAMDAARRAVRPSHSIRQ